MNRLKNLRSIAVFAACSFLLHAAPPEGWLLAGSRPAEYDCEKDSDMKYQDLPAVYLRSKAGIKTSGFGTMMQQFSAEHFLGRRVQFSANVKADHVKSWSGLWMRVDNKHNPDPRMRTLTFDNMQERAISGTKDWRRYSVVLDVPNEATEIFLGILLTGQGAVWINGITVEIVGANVRTTNTMRRPDSY